MANRLTEVREWFEQTELAMAQRGFYDTYPLNEFWRKINLPRMLDILRQSSDDFEALERIQNTYFFQISVAGRVAELTVDWHLTDMKDRADGRLDIVNDIQESKMVPERLVTKRGKRRFSVDTFRVANIAFNIAENCQIDRSAEYTFFELGAGLGSLARFAKCLVPNCKYIICDLPISLCYSYMFLSRNFPDQRMLLVQDSESLLGSSLLDEFDVIFVPPHCAKQLVDYDVDVFINTCSLGEMDNSVSKQWFDFIQEDLNPRYLYSLNRFLNRIDHSPEYEWRESENGCSFFFDKNWDVTRFSIEDSAFFGPYLSSIHPRYLEVILRRTRDKVPDRVDPASVGIVDSFLCYDWLTLHDQFSWAIRYRGANLTNDLSKTGPIFRFWENARVVGDIPSYLMLLGYMDFLNLGDSFFFEEVPFIEGRLAQLASEAGAEIERRLLSVIDRRRTCRDTGHRTAHQEEEIFRSISDLIQVFLPSEGKSALKFGASIEVDGPH